MKFIVEKQEVCQFCGSKEGYYTKSRVSGVAVCKMSFDGSECDNGEMHEGIRYNQGNFAYCSNCGKRIFNIKTGELCGKKL